MNDYFRRDMFDQLRNQFEVSEQDEDDGDVDKDGEDEKFKGNEDRDEEGEEDLKYEKEEIEEWKGLGNQLLDRLRVHDVVQDQEDSWLIIDMFCVYNSVCM